MGDSKLCLLLLLSTSALAFGQDDVQPACLLAKRYKTHHKYEYQYKAQSLNELKEASHKNGPEASCTVVIEVPQTCSFVLRTTGCSLSELVDKDRFEPASTSDAFAAEMEKYPLRFVVGGEYDVKLYPEDGETTTILNFKRGIISALAVPLLEEGDNRNMPTIHGRCRTYYQVNAREDIATDVNLKRDLSKCENFVPIRDHSSPLALVSGMHYPLSKLFHSFQTCNYKFDNNEKHMTSGSCIEKHALIPFSQKGQHAVMSVGKQELTLVQVFHHNDRVFEHGDVVAGLHMDAVEDKSAVQDENAFLKLLRDLATLSEAAGERRAPLFQQLVSMVRGMKADTLSPAVPKALAVSQALTYQVLAQCGTPECSSAMMQILRTTDRSSFKIDATVFALGLISNPSAFLIKEMLETAKYKPSRPVMYALSNAVKRFYKAEGKLIPEIHSVAEFMAARLGDCSGSDADNFMTLRVVGNMAPAVMPASPALRSAVTQCVNQPAASLAVQQAAIQAYRLIPVPKEDGEILMQVLLDGAGSVQKRIAAYLILMKDPQPSQLVKLTEALSSEQDVQVKSFVGSHINNILTSTEPETQELRQRIRDALQGNQIGPVMDGTKFSNNYRIGSVEGNMLFESSSSLPKEAMLEMTLKAFGYEIDMMEIGMAGNGFDPTVEALFGENGFFPDSALKTMYFVSENMPLGVNEIMQNMLPDLGKNRMRRQAPTNLIQEVKHNINKLVKELRASQSPEAMVYLRLLGNELGYLSSNDMGWMTFSATMMIENMLKMFPRDLMEALVTKTDNTIFGHYIFMDNEFFLPTGTGIPLRVALSGTFTPGIKGGLRFARDMSELSFMPSAGVEFVTHIGSHLSEYVNSGVETHTNIFHRSGLSARLSVKRDQVKLTIPAPTTTTLIKITTDLVAVTNNEVKTLPTTVADVVSASKCALVFAGMKFCSTVQYIDAASSSYFPFTGNSKFALELHPTGQVTEYTATVGYELLTAGEDGRQKVDSVKFILRAEGAEPTEARAVLKYNRRKSVMTADVQIPDYDVEAGLRLGAEGRSRGKDTYSISLDFLNKNIPQLSLAGRANLKAMKEGKLQGQLIVPSLNADATVTGTIKYDQDLELELKSEMKLMAATSEQTVTVKYGGESIEVEFKSGVNAKTSVLPGAELFAKYGEQLLDTQVGQTDMKVRHVFKKLTEAANNYVEKYGDGIPYIQNFRIPDIPEISLPETLFLITEAKATYHFSNEYFTFTIPVPLGGKSTEDLNFPPAINIPSLSLPQLGLDIPPAQIPIPELTVPESFIMSIPLFGKAELSARMRSNLYNMEASVAVDAPNYSAKMNVKGTSPIDVLSAEIDGLGLVVISDSVTASMKSSLVHKFIKASVSITEEASITDKINLKSSSKIEAMSSSGVSFVIQHTGTAGINTEDISADNMFEAMFSSGPLNAKTSSSQSFAIFPFRPEAKIDSTVEFDSTFVKAQNAITASLANGELSVVSNTKAFEDSLTHVAEISVKDRKVSMKCGANVNVLGVKIQRQTEASAGATGVTAKVETHMELAENRAYSLLTASLDDNGLAVNNNAMLKLLGNQLTHKASLKFNDDGLTTSGTTAVQSLLSLENTFDGGLDFSKATLSITNKAALSGININNGNRLTITRSTLDFKSKTYATGSEHASYTHDISLGLKPFSASASISNNLDLLSANFQNKANLEAEIFKIDVTGSLTATCGQDEIKHTYELKYADMTANAKFNTAGKVLGTQMNHNTELDVFGLAATVTNNVRFNSQPMRFDHTIRCSIVPFDISFDAVFNADGDVVMYGQHKAQLYGKYNLKAQPLVFVSVHECRASVTNTLDNDLSLETTFDTNTRIDFSPQEQQTKFKLTSKMNNHAFNQGLSLYNTAERTGIELFGTVFTDMFNADSTENQEFTVSAFLKYDKSTDSHVIHLPLIENVDALLESIKDGVVRLAEELQNYITTYELIDALDKIPQILIDLVSELHIKENVIQLKQHFSDFMQKSISVEDFKDSIRHLNKFVEKRIYGLLMFVGYMTYSIDETLSRYAFIQEVRQQLHALEKKYKIGKIIHENINMVVHCIDKIFNLIPRDPIQYIVVNLDIPNRLNALCSKIKELIVKLEADKMIEASLEKLVELFQQLRIEETIQTVLQAVKDANIPQGLMREFKSAIAHLKLINVNINELLEFFNMFIEIFEFMFSLNYNEMVGFINDVNGYFATKINERIKFFEIPQKLEATKAFVDFMFVSTKSFTDHLRDVKVAEIIKSVQDIIDEGVVNSVKTWAKFIKQKITDLNLKDVFTKYLNRIRNCFTQVITTMTKTVEMIKMNIAPDLEIISEVQQIINFLSKLEKAEVTIPSLPIPFTDLVLPSVVFKMDELEIPTQLEIPEFTILGIFIVTPTTISLDDIKQIITKLTDSIINLQIKMLDADALFGDLTLNFLPTIPEISLPDITFPEISFPAIPKVPVENLVNSLQVPRIKLPRIPYEITVPSFGRLYGEIRLLTPIYTVVTSGELNNPTTHKMSPQLTGYLNSYASSEHFEILNYELNSTARIAIPKMSRVVLGETVKFTHLALGIDHKASVSLYGQSAQAQAKTDVKVKTLPYAAKITNTAFIAVGGGMSAKVDTAYNHLLDLPCIGIQSEASVTQKSVARQDGLSFTLTVDNSCEGKINNDNSNHKSNLELSVSPSTVTLGFSGDTDVLGLKTKQEVTAESGIFSHFKFNVRSEADAEVFKNSVLVASGQGNLYDMKVELTAKHDAELHGGGTGQIANVFNLVARPSEFVYEFHNKGSWATLHTLRVNIELQNDYTIVLRPDRQQLATVALARLDQWKMFYNFTFSNNEKEAGAFAATEGTGILYYLNLPVIWQELNTFELPALHDIIGITEQSVAVDAKLVYQKGQPFANIMGLIQIPRMANVITELSVKSALINLNANAGLYPEDNLVFRLGATTTSVFESLNAKLQGTTSLTTKRGIKLANSLSLENPHIEGSHNSTISATSESFETTVATTAKISLPIFTLETKQSLVTNTKSKPNVVSTWNMKGDFDLPVIPAVGKAEADHNMKLEGTLEYVSLESTTRANVDGTVDTNYVVLGVLDNEVSMYLNNNGLRSTSKVTADAKVNHGTTRVISLDVNENLAIEASPSHVYAMLTYTNNNEARLVDFHTKGTHVAKATVDIAPSSLTADIEINVVQPTTIFDINISEKTVAEVTVLKQKISTTAKFASPLCTTNLEADFEGQLPVFKGTFKSSITSDNVLTYCSINVSSSANYENEALNMINTVALTGADLTLDVNHVISKSLRMKREADASVSRHTLKASISSPAVTYANLDYAAGRDGISASASTPFTGLLGFQLIGPTQSAKVYHRYPSAPDVDVDILVIKSSPVDADKMNLQIVYNIEAHNAMLSELGTKLDDSVSEFITFVDELLTELLDDWLDEIIDAMFDDAEALAENIRNIEIEMPDGDVMTVYQILEPVGTAFITILQELMDFVSDESFETLIDKVDDTLADAFEDVDSYIDSVFDYLETVTDDIYDNLAPEIKIIVDQLIAQGNELFSYAYAFFVHIANNLYDQIIAIDTQVSDFLMQVSEDAKPYFDVNDERLEINLPFPFQQ